MNKKNFRLIHKKFEKQNRIGRLGDAKNMQKLKNQINSISESLFPFMIRVIPNLRKFI